MGSALMLLALTAVLFLVLRGVVLWYWRVNRAVEVLENLDANLARLGRTKVLLENIDLNLAKLAGGQKAED